MQDSKQIEFIAERIVSEVLSRHLPELRQEMVRRVMAELPAATAGEGGAAAAVLEAAMTALQDVTAQADVLNVLLDFAARFSGRTALFVLRGESATVWQARGFPDDNGLRSFSLNLTGGVVTRVLKERVPVAAGLDFDAAFLTKVGHAAGDNAILLPLVLRDKVSALVYADCGLEGGRLDVAALKLLVRSASMWLEVLTLRKAMLGVAAAAEPVPAPERAAAAAASTAAPAASTPPAPTPAPAVPSAETAPAPDENEIHARAQRFARLLVDEIKLYNETKVADGRQHKDLYDRLKDDIDKSRASYNKRYGKTPAAAADYFTKELIRTLAENDPALLGANFPG